MKSILIKVSDEFDISFVKQFNITIKNENHAPTDILFAQNEIKYDLEIGSLVGVFKTIDSDTGNDYPVYLHDFTQIGNWLGQTDAAAVAGRYSTIENTLYQVSDDNIKTMAEGVSFKDMTLISGSNGLPIDLGQYGFNRGKSRISIDGVYI